jgi:hypothetical protein
LTIIGSRVLASFEPDLGSVHERKLVSALLHASTTRDSDRSGLDVNDITAIVLEHLRPIDPQGIKNLTPENVDAVSRLAQRHLPRAPLAHPPEILAPTPNERLLRRYLAAYGLPSIGRTTTDRDATDRELIETIRRLIATRPDRIVIYSPWPSPRLRDGLWLLRRRLRNARIVLDWSVTNDMAGLPSSVDVKGKAVEQVLEWHADAARDKGARALRKLGIRTPIYPCLPLQPRKPTE